MIDYRDNNKWTVYIHISPSDKYYVGITSQKYVSQRWRCGKGYSKNPHFTRAINKYGWNNFQHEIIAEHLTKDEACDMEKRLIKELNSNDYHYGYNICSGGEGATGLFGEKNPNYGNYWSDEQRKRMSDIKRGTFCGELNPMYGKKLSDEQKELMRLGRLLSPISYETRKKMSEATKRNWQNPIYRERMSGKNSPSYGRIGEKHPMYGRHGKDNPNSKAVICLNNNTVYYSASEAHNNLGVNYSKLCMCCRGERKSCGKDKNGNPLHWKYYSDYLKENNLTDDEARKSLFFIE